MHPGDVVDRYRVISLLGQGGMGEVYLAEDTTLGRKVALKFLPAGLVTDEERLRRFTQEAKAASALNHPNILTIYEIGRAGGTYFLATEFIDGRTLRHRIGGGRLSPRDAVDLALQATAGLIAAHAAGIVHRDIKPENMMVRPDGYLKILDFGLAKLIERDTDVNDAPTEAAVRTGAGVVMGTARYMSPEQARGLPLDARTDIFSLGAVLYEALAGRPAFDGETASHVIVSVIEKDPPPLSWLVPEIPAELERIVSKALSKDPEERFQSVKDLSVDLKRLKQRIDVDAELSRSTPAQGQPPAPAPRRTGARVWIAGALLALAAATVLALFRWQTSRAPDPPAASSNTATMTLTRLTTTGTATQAAISPDGRYVVHAVGPAGQQSLWMRQTATSSNVQIVPASPATYGGLVFSPDGNFLLFTKATPGSQPALYEMPGLGGPARKVLDDVNGRVDFSPDGSRVVFWRRAPGARVSRLLMANRDGSGEREIASLEPPAFFSPPSWSPDGTFIAAMEQRFAPAYHGRVVVIPAEGGQTRAVGSRTWFAVRGVQWVSGNRLVLLASEGGLEGLQLWSMTYPEGDIKKITNDLNTYSGLSVTADGRSIVTTQTSVTSAMWVLPGGDTKNARPITTGLGQADGHRGVTWTADDRIVFTSGVGTGYGLYTARADGRDPAVLASAAYVAGPSACGAGRIVYTGDRGEGPRLFRVDANGQDARQLLQTTAGEVGATCSPDGQWVVYRAYADGQLWRVAIDGSGATQLTRNPQVQASFPAISPDGRWIAYASVLAGTTELLVIPSAGGPPSKQFGVSSSVAPNSVQWTADGTGLSYVSQADGADNIWIQPLAGGPGKQLTEFSSDRIFNHAWSKTGQLLLSRGSLSSDAVLIKDW